MSQLNTLFRKRINIPEDEPITFDSLESILEKTAHSIPFENLCILANKTKPITQENLFNKILVHQEGGLCYELNSILYLFLIENGFDAVLARGVVYNGAIQDYLPIGRTHVTILVTHNDQTYVIDTGFGANLPLKPVPLSGETVISSNGEFRIKKAANRHGDYVLELKLKHKDTDWRIGYCFDSTKPITDVSELDEVQTIIVEHEESPFNKNRLVTRLTADGNVTLTDTSFTQWADGNVTKEEIDFERYKNLLKQHFEM